MLAEDTGAADKSLLLQPLHGDRQKFVWAQLILRQLVDTEVAVSGRWDSQTKRAFRRFQERSGILRHGREGHWTVETTHALAQIALQWILGEPIRNALGKRNDNLVAAIRRFQRIYRIGVDGKMGPETRQAMINVLTSRWPIARADYHFHTGPWAPQADAQSMESLLYGSVGSDLAALAEAFSGDDSRVITKDVLELPFRQVCRLEVTIGKERVIGTGFLISPRHVVTAAHNLTDLKPNKFLLADRVVISPAHAPFPPFKVCRKQDEDFHCSQTSDPIGTFAARRENLGVPKAFATQSGESGPWERNPALDFAVITLPLDGGKTAPGHRSLHYKPRPDSKVVALGQFGWWGKPGFKLSTEPLKNPKSLVKKSVHVTGYSRDSGHQQYETGVVQSVRPLHHKARGTHLVNQFLHTARTRHGTSGGPIWTREPGGELRLVGIATRGFNTMSTDDGSVQWSSTTKVVLDSMM